MNTKAKIHAPDFCTTIDGIPCGIEVTWYYGGTDFPIHSASLEPNDPEEFEFNVLDRKGYLAPWLERKMTESDECRILDEYKEHMKDVY